jgi:hypothetical protein
MLDDTGADPTAFAHGLGWLELGAEVSSETFRDRDRPGI